MDFFEIFGLPHHLHVDTQELEKRFYSQSRKLHPDRFAARPPAEQAEALERSSALNDAYRTLRDPIARTEYLLALEGVQMEEQSRKATDAARASGTEKKQVAPPDLLEEAFELNMQLEEMRSAKLSGEKDEFVERDLKAAQARYIALLEELGHQLEGFWTRWDAAEATADASAKSEVRDGMVALLNRRSYVRNLVRDVEAALA